MVDLENTDSIIRPSCDRPDGDEDDDARDQTECVEDSGDREDAETDLGLNHQDGGSQPSNLEKLARKINLNRQMDSRCGN